MCARVCAWVRVPVRVRLLSAPQPATASHYSRPPAPLSPGFSSGPTVTPERAGDVQSELDECMVAWRGGRSGCCCRASTTAPQGAMQKVRKGDYGLRRRSEAAFWRLPSLQESFEVSVGAEGRTLRGDRGHLGAESNKRCLFCVVEVWVSCADSFQVVRSRAASRHGCAADVERLPEAVRACPVCRAPLKQPFVLRGTAETSRTLWRTGRCICVVAKQPFRLLRLVFILFTR